MPRKLSLHGFLRQDILSGRSKALLRFHEQQKSGLKRESGVVLPLGRRTKSNSRPPNDNESEQKADSIFGEPVFTKKEVKQKKLDQFLADDRKDKSNIKGNVNSSLKNLREELNALVKRELAASLGERVQIRREKSKLIEKIGKLEAKDSVEKVKGHKDIFLLWTRCGLFSDEGGADNYLAKSDEEAMLPEPMAVAEKKQLQWAKARASKAVLGLELWHLFHVSLSFHVTYKQ
jgi:hypothetical protein